MEDYATREPRISVAVRATEGLWGDPLSVKASITLENIPVIKLKQTLHDIIPNVEGQIKAISRLYGTPEEYLDDTVNTIMIAGKLP